MASLLHVNFEPNDCPLQGKITAILWPTRKVFDGMILPHFIHIIMENIKPYNVQRYPISPP